LHRSGFFAVYRYEVRFKVKCSVQLGKTVRSVKRLKKFKSSQIAGGAKMNEEMIEVVNPAGMRATKQLRLAPRKYESLAHKRIGLLDNNKPNADKFLADVGTLLKMRYDGVELIVKRKMTRIAADCLEELAERCDVVINAFAD
jgi:hypothetical protein